ncbi:MAG TPA: hypothetical protein PKL84_03695 [Candidatus Hydrogenedentes bacterium]|nr:hypothetical protein [Candidatus Hydrogenedentota bacterium]
MSNRKRYARPEDIKYLLFPTDWFDYHSDPTTHPTYHDELEQNLAAHRRRLALLVYLQFWAATLLTDCERRAILSHYFEALALRTIAQHDGKQPSSVMRACRRAERKLRQQARHDDMFPLARTLGYGSYS